MKHLSARHKRLLGILCSLLCLTVSIGLYLFVLIHEHHVWSIFINWLLLFFMIITPACCYGYNVNDEIQYSISDLNGMDEQTVLNYRDIGYGLALVFYFLTYVMNTVAWYSSTGRNPTWIGTSLLFYGNLLFMMGFIGFIKIRVVGTK